jgi:hypothetical protein
LQRHEARKQPADEQQLTDLDPDIEEEERERDAAYGQRRGCSLADLSDRGVIGHRLILGAPLESPNRQPHRLTAA